MLNIKTVQIISFYGLDADWQEEARSNLEEYAEDTLFIEPEEGHNPKEHILMDLSECIQNSGVYEKDGESFDYNCTISISNNSAMLLNLSDCGECALVLYV